MPEPLPSLSISKPPGAFRLIHTADWHLGKPLGDLDRIEEYRRFLAWMEQTIEETKADALLVAGDLFDSATPPQSAVRLYFDFLASLHARSACPVVIISGNHDSPAHLEAPQHLLQRVNCRIVAGLLPDEEGLIPLIPLPNAENPQLLVAAIPFLRERDLRRGELGQSAAEIQRELQEGLKKRYAEAAQAATPWHERGIPLLATGHLTALGATTSESEREIHVGGLGAISADAFPTVFDYIALGHLHRPQAVGGKEQIRYSGSPLTLSFSEAKDRKEIRVLDFLDGKLVGNHSIPVPQPRTLATLRVTEGDWKNALTAFSPPPSDLPAWVELSLAKTSPGEDLCRQARELAESLPFEIVRVVTDRAATIPMLESTGPDETETLLEDPKAVFARRLEAEADLTEETRSRLLTTFDELLERNHLTTS